MVRFYALIGTACAAVAGFAISGFVGPGLNAYLLQATVRGDDPPAVSELDLRPIGGKWYVTTTEPATYYYKDANRFVDLFSYHTKDSNKDGIPNLQITHDDAFLILRSQGYPNHPTAIFPNSDNPNSIRVQDFTFRLPLEPKLAGKITRVPMGPIGMALNGVVFFNPFEMGGMNAVEGSSEVWLDACCGHPQQTGVYHYHKYPACVKSPFSDNGKGHSPIIGFAFDGFPLYGPYESEGRMALELTSGNALDACNGHSDPQRGYHYHVTPGRFPYILGGYAGVVEPSNNRGLQRSPAGALEENTIPGNKYDGMLPTIRPGNLARGSSHKIMIDIDPQALRRTLPEGKPSWVQFGPFEAKSIEREGNTITAEIEIPRDAALGVLLDCHIEFGSERRPFVIKKNDAIRITE
ncbi:MAG: YHYH protein [Pirellula sp.]